MEQWSSGGGGLTVLLPNSNYFDERAIFSKLTVGSTNLTVAEILLFLAYVTFLSEHEGAVDIEKLNQWMRVIHNLIVNSNIDRIERIPDGIKVVQTLAPHSGDILHHLQTWIVEDTFGTNVKQQASEEVLKAQLLLADNGWQGLIDRAELHGYFRGQIEFLLDFCGVIAESVVTPVTDWAPSKHQAMQAAFESSLRTAEAMFSSKGLVATDDFVWARALIVVGDYLIEARGNKSLLVDAANEQYSWKRLLRGFTAGERVARNHLKALWSRLDYNQSFVPQLKRIISDAGSDVDKWRVAIATTPDVWNYGNNRMIRFADNSNVYVLYRMQMNGSHVELFSYSFFKQDLQRMNAAGQLEPLKVGGYIEVNTIDQEPYFGLNYSDGDKDLSLEIDFVDATYRIGVLTEDLADSAKMKEALEKIGPLVVIGSYDCVVVPPNELGSALETIALELRT